MKKYITLLIRRRFWVIGILLLLTVLFGLNAARGIIASSLGDMFFSDDHADFNHYQERIQEYANDEAFIVIYKDSALLSEKSLRKLEPVPAFRQMGIVLGVGVAVALLLAMTLTPILFALLKQPISYKYETSRSQDTLRILGTLLPFTLVVALLGDILLVPALVKLGVIRFR